MTSIPPRSPSSVPWAAALLIVWVVSGCAGPGHGRAPLVDGEARLEAVIELCEARFLRPLAEDPRWIAGRAAARDALAAGADWRPVVDELLAGLDTSHTAALTPDQSAFHHVLGIFGMADAFPQLYPDGEVSYVGAGWFLQHVDGEAFVSDVMPGTPAERAGVLRGDRLVSVDGAPWSGLPSWGDRPGVERRLTVQRERGGPLLELTLVPERLRPRQVFLDAMRAGADVIRVENPGSGGSGEPEWIDVAWVRVWSYADPAAQELLTELLIDGPLSDAQALILDLRGGWGGAQPAYVDLFSRTVPRLTMIDREGRETGLSDRWGGPVTLLIDGGTRSGKEVIAHAFRRHGIGRVVGQRTAGAVVGGTPFPLGDDLLVYLAVVDVEVDGERIEGVGVPPDVEVARPLPYSAGADPQLERALADALASWRDMLAVLRREAASHGIGYR